MTPEEYLKRQKELQSKLDRMYQNANHTSLFTQDQDMFELSQETIEAISEACLDDSTKIIRYLEEKEQHKRLYNLTMLILAIISAVGAVIAAITGIIVYF